MKYHKNTSAHDGYVPHSHHVQQNHAGVQRDPGWPEDPGWKDLYVKRPGKEPLMDPDEHMCRWASKRWDDTAKVLPLTPQAHYAEASRLLAVIDDGIQDGDVRPTLLELAVIALAHAMTGLAADTFQDTTGE